MNRLFSRFSNPKVLRPELEKEKFIKTFNLMNHQELSQLNVKFPSKLKYSLAFFDGDIV